MILFFFKLYELTNRVVLFFVFVLRGRLSVCDLIGFTALNPNPREENRVILFKFVNTVLSILNCKT